MVKAITGTYRDGRVELNEQPLDRNEPAQVVTIFLKPGEKLPPEIAQILDLRSLSHPNSQLLPDSNSRLAKLQEFITTRAQQQPSPEADEYFQQFRSNFDAEREPERKLFH